MKSDLLSPCGLYCGVCGVYLAYITNDLNLKQDLLSRFQKWGANNVDDIACEGCMSNGIIFPFCQTCTIKDCICKKELKSCKECKEFPCEIIETWPSPDGKKVMLEEIKEWYKLGTPEWVRSVEEKHKCLKCGTQLYRGAQKCYTCNEPVIIRE